MSRATVYTSGRRLSPRGELQLAHMKHQTVLDAWTSHFMGHVLTVFAGPALRIENGRALDRRLILIPQTAYALRMIPVMFILKEM